MQPDQIARYQYEGIFSAKPDLPEPWVYLVFFGILIFAFYSGYRAGATQKDIDRAEENFFGESD